MKSSKVPALAFSPWPHHPSWPYSPASLGAGAHKQGLFGGSKALLAKRHSLPAGTLRDKASSSAVPQATDANKPAAPSSKQLQAQQHSLPAGTLREKVSGGGIERALVPSRSSHRCKVGSALGCWSGSDDASSKCTRPIGWLKANGHLMDVVECTSQPVFLWQCHSPKMPEVPRGNASAPHFTLSLDVLNNQTSVEASLSGDGHVQSLAVPSPQVGLCFYAHVAMQSSVGTYFRESIKKEERRAKQLSYASTEAEELRSFQAYCASLVLQ
eukprot:173463-Pelagomonas_calceolata.AAC.4